MKSSILRILVFSTIFDVQNVRLQLVLNIQNAQYTTFASFYIKEEGSNMGKRQSKEFRRRLEVKEKNKNNWKEKIEQKKIKENNKEIETAESLKENNNNVVEVEILPLENGEEEIKVTLQEKNDLLRISVGKPRKRANKIKEKQTIVKKFSKKTEVVFETRDARLADQKRKEEYQKIVFKKLDEMQEENER